MTKTILITGVSGYLGALLAKRLVDNGYSVTGLDRTPPKKIISRMKFVQSDLSHPYKVDQILKKNRPEIICHAAGLLSITQNAIDPRQEELFEVNVRATNFIMNAAVMAKVQLFIFISSMCVYGIPLRVPVREDAPLNPISFYGTTKIMGERLLESYCKLSTMRGVALRPMGFFGNNRRSGLIYQWMLAAKEGRDLYVPRGLSIPWNVTPVEDVIDAISLLLACPLKKRYLDLNIGFSQPIHLKKLAYQIISVWNSKSRIRMVQKGKNIPFSYDTNRAKKLIGWKSSSLVKSLREYAEEIKADRGR